ncbi:MAG: helix-turn-helix transcriptional regulator [archaeon]
MTSTTDWNDQLIKWYDSQKDYATIKELAEATGIPRSTLSDYLNKKATNLKRVADKRKDLLYRITGLDVFRTGAPLEEDSKPYSEVGGYEQLMEKFSAAVSELSQIEKILSQNYPERVKQITAKQRASDIVELFKDAAGLILSFNTASNNEIQILMDKLKENREVYMTIVRAVGAYDQEKPEHVRPILKLLPDKLTK